jgi:Putative auto-transporter adhesin, head GIN domain
VNRLILVMTISLSTFTVSSDSPEEALYEIKNFPRFSAINLDGISKVRVHQGPQAVQITIDHELRDYYEAFVKDETLFLGFKSGLSTLWAMRHIKKKTCEIVITMPDLDMITLNGSGKIIIDEFIFSNFDIIINGAGTIEASGKVSNLRVGCNGASRFLASDLKADTGIISMTGSAYVEINVKDSIEASITGAGKLLYWGKPQVSNSITGAGIIQRSGD